MTPREHDHHLHALLRDHAPTLDPGSALRERILASAPGYALRLDRILRDAHTPTLPATPALLERIVAAAPAGDLRGFLASLWPFGPMWRPAVGLAILAIIGALLGSNSQATLRGEVSVSGALSEEVYVLAMSVTDTNGAEAFGWDE